MTKKNKISKLGAEENPVKIVVLGARQSGKTSFFTAAYHISENLLDEHRDSISSGDYHTLEKIRKKISAMKKGMEIMPTETDRCDKYKFQLLPKGKEDREPLFFEWLDYAGEYCGVHQDELTDDDRATFNEFTKKSDGCCIVIDSEKLMNNEDVHYICDQLGQIRKNSRYKYKLPYPVALVFTKTDLLGNSGEDFRENLIDKAAKLTRRISGEAYRNKIFLSKITSENGEIISKGPLSAMTWLVLEIKKNYTVYSKLMSKIKATIDYIFRRIK